MPYPKLQQIVIEFLNPTDPRTYTSQIEIDIKKIKDKDPEQKSKSKQDKIRSAKLAILGLDVAATDAVRKDRALQFLTTFSRRNEEDLTFLFPDMLTSRAIAGGVDISAEFHRLNGQYRYFEAGVLEEFNRVYMACLYIAQVTEENYAGMEREVGDRAYKLLALFGSDIPNADVALKNFDSFAEQYTVIHKLHDAFATVRLPTPREFNLKAWQLLISNPKTGLKALRAVGNAPAIERVLADAKGPKAPVNKEELENGILRAAYRRSQENPKLAKLFNHYSVTEQTFDAALEFLKKYPSAKKQDNLPEIIVDHAGYYLIKLPSNNVRGLILGDITHCCQSIDGNSRECVVDGMTRPNNGFYVMLKPRVKKFDIRNIDWPNLENTYDILGQAYAWKTTYGNLVLDSWEGLRPADDSIAVELLEKFSQTVLMTSPDIYRVTIGTGGKTPRQLVPDDIPKPDMLEGTFYGDARVQHVLATRAEKEGGLIKKKALNEQHCKAISMVLSLIPDKAKAHEIIREHNPSALCVVVDGWMELLSGPYHIQLTSDAAAAAYLKGATPKLVEFVSAELNPGDICGLAVELVEIQKSDKAKFAILTSEKACRLYKSSVGFKDLAGLDYGKLSSLFDPANSNTFESIRGCCQNLRAEFSEVITMNPLLLVTMWKCISNSKVDLTRFSVNFDEAKEILKADFEKFKIPLDITSEIDISKMDGSFFGLLFSDNAQVACDVGANFSWLVKNKQEMCELLLSDSAVAAYKAGIPINYKLIPGIIKTPGNVDDLVEIKRSDPKKFTILTSKNACELYEARVKVKDLATLDATKMSNILEHKNEVDYKIFTSIKKCCKYLGAEFSEVVGMEPLILLIIGEFISDFDATKFGATFAEAKKILVLDATKLKIDLAPDKITKIKKQMSNGFFALLFNPDAEQAYLSGAKFPLLVDLGQEKCELLLSEGAAAAYKAGATFNDLLTISERDQEKLKALTSEEAITAYKAGATFNDLVEKKDETFQARLIRSQQSRRLSR